MVVKTVKRHNKLLRQRGAGLGSFINTASSALGGMTSGNTSTTSTSSLSPTQAQAPTTMATS